MAKTRPPYPAILFAILFGGSRDSATQSPAARGAHPWVVGDGAVGQSHGWEESTRSSPADLYTIRSLLPCASECGPVRMNANAVGLLGLYCPAVYRYEFRALSSVHSFPQPSESSRHEPAIVLAKGRTP
jgi:hypothetical protein